MGYFSGQFVAIANTEIDDVLEGIFQIKEIDQNDARKFTYEVPFVASAIGSNIVSGQNDQCRYHTCIRTERTNIS